MSSNQCCGRIISARSTGDLSARKNDKHLFSGRDNESKPEFGGEPVPLGSTSKSEPAPAQAEQARKRKFCMKRPHIPLKVALKSSATERPSSPPLETRSFVARKRQARVSEHNRNRTRPVAVEAMLDERTDVSCEEIMRRTRVFRLARMRREIERGMKGKGTEKACQAPVPAFDSGTDLR